MWTKRGRTPGWRAAAIVLLGALAFIAAACGGEEIVVQTVIVEKVVPGEKVIETVIVEKQVTEKVIETVIVERPVTRIEKVVETVIVEKIVAGETVKVVETVIVDRPVTRIEKVVETVVVEKIVEKKVVETVVVEKIVEVEVPAVPVGEPTGSMVSAVSSVGPPNYELFQLQWPWNDRNNWIGAYDTLFYQDNSQSAIGVLTPSAASGWRITNDALILQIRDDIAWHDSKYGNLTVEDIMWSLERAVAEGTRWTRAEAYRTNYVEEEVFQSGDFELTMPWDKKDAKWDNVPRDIGLQSKKFFDDVGADEMNIIAMGTGPYRILKHVADDIIAMEAVFPHWRETAFVKTFDLLDIPEETVRVAMLKTGEADIIQAGLPSIVSIQAIPGVRIQSYEFSTGRSGVGIFPTGQYYQTEKEDGTPTDRKPLTNLPWVGETKEQGLKVRQALAKAIDRAAIGDNILGGLYLESYGWNMGPGHTRWTDEMQKKWGDPLRYDPEGAKKLLAEAGFPDGFEFPFFIPSGLNSTLEQVCQAMVPMWAAVGLTAKVDTSAYSSVRPKMLARTMDVVWCWLEGGWNERPDGLYRFSSRAVWNPGIEYPEVLDFETRILEAADFDASWEVIANEWLPWYYDNLPAFSTVTFTTPMVFGKRIASWPVRNFSTRWPRNPWLIQLTE